MDFKKTKAGVVINTNKDGFLKARKMKSLVTKERNRISELEKRVESQELLLKEILDILKNKQ